MSRRKTCNGSIGIWRCPLRASKRVSGPGGSVPFCRFHARRWRDARDYTIRDE